ncbi:DUF2628 domain-containing protein [Rhizobium sp. FKY42]|uniref:DUF2628 domain-containing protein n=1 Tax=Rhizobium sp. FKY42 TaxID=2562310 RepID=UPI0010C101B2|nr:DUF2628 domain-containing protein [Rhizobium sp. FKY42]
MTSYIVLTPPGGPEPDHRSTQFVADRMVWTAFVFPGFWLLFNRCWLWGIAALFAQFAAGWLADRPGLLYAGMAAQLAIALLIGLEGRQILIRTLMRRGWVLDTVVTAQDLATAEHIYFGGPAGNQRTTTTPKTDWTKLSAEASPAAQYGPSFGLFDTGRR